MKRISAFFLAIILLMFFGCTNNTAVVDDEQTVKTSIIYEIPGKVCIYPPEEYRLVKSLKIVDIDFEPSKRFIYYDLSLLASYLPNGVLDEYDATYYGQEPEPTEMALVTFIRKYKISKDSFEEVVQRRIESYLEEGFRGYDFLNEIYELPNPDIIYTFDNELIDAYYRRENPVAPVTN